MTGNASLLTCDRCGKQFRSKRSSDGQSYRCTCGGRIATPASLSDDAETYDLVPEPTAKPRTVSMHATPIASPPPQKPTRSLAYVSAKPAAPDQFDEQTLKNLHMPLWL